MVLFTVEELERLGIPYTKTSQFVFQGRRFTKGQSFSQNVRSAAIDLYKTYVNSGNPCLLVECPEYVTICRQK